MLERIDKVFSFRAFFVSAISASLALLLLLTSAQAFAFGSGKGASLNIPCGGGYSTIYEAYNLYWWGSRKSIL